MEQSGLSVGSRIAGLRERLSPWLPRARKALPWGSLALGVFGAFSMDRNPRRAGLVAAAAIVGWGVLAALLFLHHVDPERQPRLKALALKAARFGSVAANQWLIQLALFFSLPFFFRAAVWSPGHFAFLLLLSAAAAASLWDPLSEALLKRRLGGLPLQAIACFCGLDVVLPMLGLSNRVSLWLAALLAAVGLPLAAIVLSAPGQRVRDAVIASLAAALAPMALLLGGARAVPAAPLRLIDSGIGSAVVRMELTDRLEGEIAEPGQLTCFSAIWAPAGLNDSLFHVWSKDGKRRDRIPVHVSGGRDAGFRTWSTKRSFGPEPLGRWSCAVETASGQLLGERSIEITSRGR